MVASQSLRAVLEAFAIGEPIEDSPRLREFRSALEFFLPEELGWRYESFDAFRFAVARKIAPDEAEFIGLALLISEQAWTPIHLCVRLAPDAQRIGGLSCVVGERGEGRSGLLRIPYGSSGVDEFLFRLPERLGSIRWVFRAVRR